MNRGSRCYSPAHFIEGLDNDENLGEMESIRQEEKKEIC
jgi:hypothetical protein